MSAEQERKPILITNPKRPLSERKRQAILRNLEKARQTKQGQGGSRAPQPPTGLAEITPQAPPVRKTADELMRLLTEDTLSPLRPVDAVAVEQAAIAIERVRALDAYLRRHGVVRRGGEVRPAAELLLRYLRESREWLEVLGATPRSRAALLGDTAAAADVAMKLAAMRSAAARPVDASAVVDDATELPDASSAEPLDASAAEVPDDPAAASPDPPASAPADSMADEVADDPAPAPPDDPAAGGGGVAQAA